MTVRYFKDGVLAENKNYSEAFFTSHGACFTGTIYERTEDGRNDYDKPITVQELIPFLDLVHLEW